MSKATRMLAMAGMALFAGAVIGAGPAAASPSPTQGTAASTHSAVQQAGTRHDRVINYYRTFRQCERAGRIGEFFDRWNSYDCERVRWGHRRGWVALTVEWDWHGNHGGGNNGGGNGWPNGGGNHGGGNHGGGNHGGGGHW